MDATAKLELFANFMSLEPAEEHVARQPIPAPGSSVLREPRASYEPLPPSAYQKGAVRQFTGRTAPAFLRRQHWQYQPGQKRITRHLIRRHARGKRIALLKTLLTSACERNCFYCPFRAGRDFRRAATFKPDEMAKAFMELYRSRIAEGFFLSSGIAGGGIRTQDQLIDTAEILRRKMGYTGYLHLKIMPGSQRAQVERAMQLADRVSINLEAPNSNGLARLAPRKIFIDELLRPLQWVDEIRRTRAPHMVGKAMAFLGDAICGGRRR